MTLDLNQVFDNTVYNRIRVTSTTSTAFQKADLLLALHTSR